MTGSYILHIATHGFFAEVSPTLDEYGNGNSLSNRHAFPIDFFENPMHCSGLALAGAQATLDAWRRNESPRQENNGIVTAEDISGVALGSCWLATLSACDTGLGRSEAGEGVFGLRRGFFKSGVQNLLFTLWRVLDVETVTIMKEFYGKALTTGNAPQALADTQRDSLLKLKANLGLAKAVNIAGPFILSFQGTFGARGEE